MTDTNTRSPVASDTWPDPAAGLQLTTTSLPTRSHGSARCRPRPTPHHRSRSLIARYLGTWAGLLDSAGGDLDRAVRTLTAAVDHNTDAGFCPSQPPPPGNSPPTLHLNRPGDRESAAHHSADAAALTMRINSEVGT